MIEVRPVQTLERFVAGLQLRCRVYQSLGYLRRGLTMDLDQFDWSSIHLEASDESQNIVGVVRLVLPKLALAHADVTSLTSKWCDQINRQQHLGIVPSDSLPILETIRENGIDTERQHWHMPGELSRIIVEPQSRGQGVARLLADAVAHQAHTLGLDAVLLECLPNHMRFFEKLGYTKMFESLRYKYLSVPERVVAMKRAIADS